jgi:predicted patatin/cPLA2 family phospholipase
VKRKSFMEYGSPLPVSAGLTNMSRFLNSDSVMSKEIDKYWAGEVVNILEWLRDQHELFDRWAMNKISSKEVYNRYLDETKR